MRDEDHLRPVTPDTFANGHVPARALLVSSAKVPAVKDRRRSPVRRVLLASVPNRIYYYLSRVAIMTPRVSDAELAALSLSPAEVSALLEMPERRVRKEVEHGLFPSPPQLDFDMVVYLKVLDRLAELEPPVEWRRRMLKSIRNALMHGHISAVSEELELVPGVLQLRLRTVAEEVSEQLVPFYRWRDARVVSDPAILGGEPVFRDSRLSVRRVGEALERGEKVATVREDYPYLSAEDIEFAPRYVRAYPRVGRPRESSKASAG